MKSAYIRTFCVFLATMAGVGYSRYAPGTCTTVITALLIATLAQGVGWSLTVVIPCMIVAVLFAYGIIVYALPAWKDDTDPAALVIDEAIGTLTTFIGISLSLKTLILGIIFFRFFDIIKPCGIKRVEQWGGAGGILADDLLAGLCANGLLHVYVWFFA